MNYSKRIIGPPLFLIGSSPYMYYKDYIKRKALKTSFRSYELYYNVTKAIWSTIGDHIVNNPNGVYIKKHGYYSMIMGPKQKIIKLYMGQKYKSMLNFHSDLYLYYPIFFPLNSNLTAYSMDRTFAKDIYRKMSKKLHKGMRYKCHISNIESFKQRVRK